MLDEEEIEILNTDKWYEAIGIIEKHWDNKDGYFQIEGNNGKHTLELKTGECLENKKFINQLSNTAFWILWWQESKADGYYKFEYIEMEK